MRHICRAALISAMLVSVVSTVLQAGDRLSGSRPNIICVLTDDNGWGEMGITGNKILKTPILDRFYREGTRFTNFHVAALCAPTRAQLMTGQHQYRVGVTSTGGASCSMARGAVTVAECLREAGYHTAHVGKWHLGSKKGLLPHERGFETSIMCGPGGGPNSDAFDGILTRNGVAFSFEGYRTDALFDESMKWIGEVKDGRQPFFLYLATYNPHAPFRVPEKWVAPYEDKGLIDHGLVRGARLWGAGYYGEMANLDWNFGRLLEFLKAEGLEANTLVMYMTDNGHALSGGPGAGHSWDGRLTANGLYNMGLRGAKNQCWRGGTCVPWLLRWPGRINADTAIDTLAGGIDLLPTLVDLAGGAVEHEIDGVSLVPLLENPETEMAPRAMFGTSGMKLDSLTAHESRRYDGVAVQTQHYRLVHAHSRHKTDWELYDHRTDPGEENDIAAQHPKLVAELRRKYDEWFNEMIPTLYNEDLREQLSRSGKQTNESLRSRQ